MTNQISVLPGHLRWGFTPFPSSLENGALDLAYSQIAQHSDMILHHLDDGVPWDEALHNQAFPVAVEDNLQQRKSKTPAAHKVLLTATPTKQDRKTLAGYWNSGSNQALLAHWEDKSFDHPDVITAYINYCRRLIEFFQPDYFAYAIEINASLAIGSQELSRFMILADTTYKTLKNEFPQIPIMMTFQTQAFDKTSNEVLSLTELMIDHSDYLALSHYPFWLLEEGNLEANPHALDNNWLWQFRNLATDKPFAISETGYIAEDLVLPDFGINIKGNPAWQQDFVSTYLDQMDSLEAEFVMWFIVQDYDKVWEELEKNGFGDELKIWKDTGLFDGEGNERPSLQVWDNWLNRNH